MESPTDIVPYNTYYVPCVLWYPRPWNRLWCPVMLPSHSDGPEHCLNELPEHYHIDFRFVDTTTFSIPSDANIIPKSLIRKGPKLRRMLAFWKYADSLSAVNQSAFFFIARWYERHANAKARNRVCPHRGTRITNSCGTCPAHGLPWNLETESLQDFELPFRIKLLPGGESGPIVNDSCSIPIVYSYVYTEAVLVDNRGRHVPNARYALTPPRKLEAGDTLDFTADRICSR